MAAMLIMRLFCCILFFSACQSTIVKTAPFRHLLYDQGFLGFSQVSIQSEQQIFYLDAAAKAFVASTLDKSDNKTLKWKRW